MVDVLDAKPFDGKIYAIAEYDDGGVYHFYDGTRIEGWDTLSEENSSFEAVADALARQATANAAVTAEAFGATILITAREPGEGFTISTAVTVGGDTTTPTATRTQIQANVAAVAEVRASGKVTITNGSSDPGASQVQQITV